VLDEFKFFPGLAVHWVVVGPSDRKTRPAEGGVLRHYKKCATKINTQFKMIANTFYVSHVAVHPHNFEFWCDSVTHKRQCDTACTGCLFSLSFAPPSGLNFTHCMWKSPGAAPK
jgi:hypothetical protein